MCRHPHHAWRIRFTGGPVLSTLAVVIGLLLAPAGTAIGAAGPSPADDRRAAVPASVSTPVRESGEALTRAIKRLKADRPVKAATALERVRTQLALANAAAINQIGKPPVDPESDDPPGPPSILLVARLEHRIHTAVVDSFDRLRDRRAVLALKATLAQTHALRDVMLDAVIALPPDGDGADYTDGMSDTVNSYKAEVKQVTTALASARLTPGSRAGLERALIRVKATAKKVNQAWGGGE